MLGITNYIFNDRYSGAKLFLLCNVPILLHRLYEKLYPAPKPKPVTVLSQLDDYVQQITSRFLGTYQHNKSSELNRNINEEFYSKDAYRNIIKTENNRLEQEWKRRIEELQGSPERTQQLLDNLFARALDGDNNSAKLYLQATGRLAPVQLQVEHKGSVTELSDAELEAMIASTARAEHEMRRELKAL